MSRVARRISRTGAKSERQFSQPKFVERTARRIRNRQLIQGEITTVLPEGNTPQYLTVKTPSGYIILIPPDLVNEGIWLAESGVYVYRWGDGDEHEINVLSRPDSTLDDADSIQVSDLPPMTITRKPRF